MFNFGNRPASTGTAAAGGGLFGQGQAGGNTGGLFGQSNAGGNGSTGGLFGQNNTNASGTGGFFGQGNAMGGGNTVGGGMGLFGQGNMNAASGMKLGTQIGGGGVAANNANSGGRLFGNMNNSGSSAGGLFGSKVGGTTGGTGLFGSSNATGGFLDAKPSGNNASQGLFGGGSGLSNNNNNNNNAGSLGVSGTGLFSNSSNTGTMGGLFESQNNVLGLQQQQQNQDATSSLNLISQLPITSMTRIVDLPPHIRQEIEKLDQYFQRQVSISHHLKAEEAEHLELIQSVPRDVQFLLKTYSLTTQSLQQDLKRIESIKSLTDDNIRDSESFSLILNQLLTPGTKVSSAELNKFFQEKILLYKHKLDEYFRVLSDIKSAVNGLDSDMFGSSENSSSEFNDLVKTGINSIVATVIEEFELFMDMAERVAQLHQRVKELSGFNKNTIISS
ncbi:FG-nucleoporin NUP49 Ecym_8382 [Eremothecium cymbalariae DBVPG|uniref:Nucleoporin Nup54 alpha-helical domain-containing protein n=1 Tax=Eremothecium cymbalariae (strain CBS 270.75 / DBVPG 7215 / KCTC 17166 / NRRL Y-17582) TaxID=931890 RepID=G8JXS8_ERECY|nr:Hypothetical protein Ecym_8382 [Eremothecium cymbalariae DBVPG\